MSRIRLGMFLLGLTAVAVLAVIGCGSHDNATGGGSQPTITAMTPSVLNPGQDNIEAHILGTNLGGVLSVSLGDGVVVEQMSGISSQDVYVYLSVLRDAQKGPHTVVVQTNGGVATSSKVFSVSNNSLPFAAFTMTPPAGIKGTTFR